jgi:hypothetical protein
MQRVDAEGHVLRFSSLEPGHVDKPAQFSLPAPVPSASE